jgi:pimeloyl-ACP methyl ester carboxylesterase
MPDPDPFETRIVALTDGRSLEVRVAGPPDGRTLLWHHGTPSAGIPMTDLVTKLAARGIRYVAASRPGYGRSTRMPGRTIADVAADSAALLDALGVERCLVFGESGGGPHVLACAALIPDRVIAATALAAVAPFEAEGLDFLAGMGPENVDEFGAAVAGQAEIQAFLEHELPAYRDVTGAEIAEAFGGLVDEVDRASLTGTYADDVAADVRAGLATGIWGWLDDDLAFVKPWGFALDDMRVPVDLWQGGHDRMVPFAHGEWLAAHVRGADVRVHLVPEEGHLSLADRRIDEILDALTGTTEGRT